MCVFQEMLKDNITVLKHEIELHKATEANLTANITLQQGRKIQVSFFLPSCSRLPWKEHSPTDDILRGFFSHVAIETEKKKTNKADLSVT